MAVDFEKFRKWAEDRFNGDIVVKGKEIRLNSIFEQGDDGYHLWCSPSGGKKKRPYGVFRCFKTDTKGSLVKLVQIVDHCDREDALSILSGRATIHDLEKQLEEFLAAEEKKVEEEKKSTLTLPGSSYLITDLGTNNWWRKKAEEYLSARKIPIDGLYICTEQPYKARIIIPYYDKNGKLIYWNGRHIGNAKPKYRGPDKSCGVGKEDVLYMAGPWPKVGELLCVCEGEFNAKSLYLSELNAAACGGKSMGEKQAVMLSQYKILLCLDRDKPGKQGTLTMAESINRLSVTLHGSDKLMYVRPPVGFKDWNEMYVAQGPALVHHYILKNQKPLDYIAPLGMAGDVLKYL